MPLNPLQQAIATLLAENRSPDSYLAGGSALHFEANSKRYSNDLDYFHDSEIRVLEAFSSDQTLLEQHDYQLEIELQQPGYVRATVAKDSQSTKVEWAHDSSWRFMPAERSKELGYILHPIDLATNKLLALAGRDEARDYYDILEIIEHTLPLGALCWAAVGKDPGFTPLSLLELLKRRGKYHAEDFKRLNLVEKVDLPSLKTRWLAALTEAEAFISRRPPEELGCLYYRIKEKSFVSPSGTAPVEELEGILAHYGRPGGVLPALTSR